MKKWLTVVMLLLAMLLLTACGEVSAVEKQIEAIGTVTVDSEEAINAAQAAYDALPDEDKAKVENYAVLEEAHEQYALALTEQDYQAAVAVYEAGNYEEAKALFLALNGYSDSADQITACDYQIALGVLEAGNYEEAKELFTALNGYADSADKITACDYQIALGVLEAGNYEEAKELFAALNGYEDSADRINACQFMIAEQYFAEGYLNTAKAMYAELPADYAYEGHSVEERLASLEKFNSFVELCGVWNCKTMNGSVRQTHDSTGIWDQWDAEGYNYKLTITCVLNDDDTVTNGKGKFLALHQLQQSERESEDHLGFLHLCLHGNFRAQQAGLFPESGRQAHRYADDPQQDLRTGLHDPAGQLLCEFHLHLQELRHLRQPGQEPVTP